MKYSLGPVLWYWPTATLEHFYHLTADSSADIVCLGEAVCSKRRATPFAAWMDLARMLSARGKQVVISTLALLQSPSELKELQRYVENGEFIIEANDLGTVNMAAERRLPFVAGPTLNVYNADALQLLVKEGMTRWCLPVEMPRDWLVELLQQCETRGIRRQFEVEVLGYGHLPLALSARCFTARSENRAKDACETCCIHYPHGRRVLSQESQQVFVLNGIQTLSGYCYNLGNDLVGMHNDVDIVRLSPQDEETLSLIDRFRANEEGQAPLDLAKNRDCNGYWRKLPGMVLQAGD
ncbi:U32 family peptidase [Pantoea ananatis]|uniref:U32 family peptidase n=1 Tax=Pantoea ananas TaxID=553 RepID=UPI000DA65A7C|nr:U32 family peptidase [Pantoea ananatis]PZD67635.1 U32 family peptidase [Pantoea ananatis]